MVSYVAHIFNDILCGLKNVCSCCSFANPVRGDPPAIGEVQEDSISVAVLSEALETGVKFHRKHRNRERSDTHHKTRQTRADDAHTYLRKSHKPRQQQVVGEVDTVFEIESNQ